MLRGSFERGRPRNGENTEAMFGLIQSSALLAHGWNTRFLQHLSYNELAMVTSTELRASYFSFAWVRNPWERMVSAYFNKDPDLLQQAEKAGLALCELDFPDFVAATVDFPHVHLRPQHQFFLDAAGKRQVDFIGRFECFGEDFATVCKQLGRRLHLPHANASKHQAYRYYYDEASRKLIATKYAADIDFFEYAF